MNAVISGYARSPFHFANRGALAGIRPDDLSAQVVKGLLNRLDLDPALLEDIILGCAYPEASQGSNLARIVGLLAGLPEQVGGITVNRFCGASMSAIHIAAAQIEAGIGDAFLCLGVESMTLVPQGGLNPSPNPWLKEHSDDFAQRYNLNPLARIRAVATVGCHPAVMGLGPIPATQKALQRAGLNVNELGVVEINEAFASQALACIGDLHLDPDTVNLDGGGLAIGHPLGATGARITAKAASLMVRKNAKYGLATQCIGGGQGIATVLEAL